MAAANEFRLDIGGTVLALECPSAGYAESLDDYFGQGRAPSVEPDLHLRLDLEEHAEGLKVPPSLFITKQVADGEFVIGDDLVRGAFDPATGRGTLRVKVGLTKEGLTRVFEQLLYQAFYSARRRTGRDAFLIHASGVIRTGEGFLFVGASEAGKSTVARLSAGRQVVNDEIVLVEFTPDGVVLRGTPFNGHFPGKVPGRAPLRAALLLAHGPEHRLDAVDRGPATAALAGQIVPPMGLEDELTAAVRADMLELADRLSSGVPVRRLTFLPDDGFWQAIDQSFPAPAAG